MGDFRDSNAQVVVFQNLEVRAGRRMEEREVSKHCMTPLELASWRSASRV